MEQQHQFRIFDRMNHQTLKIVIQITDKAMASGHWGLIMPMSSENI